MRQVHFIAALVLVLLSCNDSSNIDETDIYDLALAKIYNQDLHPFYHGVASGDPQNHSVIIWTKVTPDNDQELEVTWNVSQHESMDPVLQSGKTTTSKSTDYTVNVDVGNLRPGEYYYYQFTFEGNKSVVGRTKTLPDASIDSLSIGVVSCSNYEWGYFNSYRMLSEKNVDFVLHLGDYIYEYGPGTYGDTTIGRVVIPPYEILKLKDYRQRYSQYRLDPDLQEIHRKHPFICIWDDHEVSNDSYAEGAQNHQAEEGSYLNRMNAAKQAYYEWIPIRGKASDLHYRSFEMGNFAQLLMLDERLAGRTKPAESYAQISDESRMLGQEQLEWLFERLDSDKSSWNIIGNSVIFSDLNLVGLRENRVNLDAWDGFPYEKREIVNYFSNNPSERAIFLTGDTHSSWAFNSPSKDIADPVNRTPSAAILEFGTPSVNSANADERSTEDEVNSAQKQILSQNPHLEYVNLSDHGYMIITLFENEGHTDWYYVDNLRSRTASETKEHAIRFLISQDGAMRFDN